MPKPNPTRKASPRRRRSAVALRRDAVARLDIEMARLQLAQVKRARAQLATYQAASRGRQNADWRAPKGSADLAIIPDAETMNPRARQMDRDSWIVKSIKKAFSRNIVGTGITPVPTVKGPDGKMLKAVNRALMRMFWAWAQDFKWCDVEERQSYWQKQNLTVEEWVIVGEHFIVWTYDPHPDRVGLRLQSFEPEQLDTSKRSHTDDAGVTREVRGGIEVNGYGAPVAYHFYTRPPNDYAGYGGTSSRRVLADRVFHFMKQERVLQTRGVSQLAPVLQQIRDFDRYDNAHLMRTLMEACVGVIIRKATVGGTGPLGVVPEAGDTQTTSSGMREIDFVPGMAPELNPGEDVTPFNPSSPGNQFEPFTKTKLRGIGAGIGLSYGQLSRQSEGSYSSARQDMLEDRKEFEPIQELLSHNQVLPVYTLFVTLAIFEGRLDDVEGFDREDYAADPSRYTQVEYVAPAPPWIDPEKEINAYEKAITLRVMDRTEVIAVTSGRRIEDVWATIESEQGEAKAQGLALPEVVAAETAMADAAQKSADAESKVIAAETAQRQADVAEKQAEAEAKRLDAAHKAQVEAAAAATAAAVPTAPEAGANPAVPAVVDAAATELSLNGAQITSVVDVIIKVGQGVIVPDVATELLIAVGIPREKAAQMVRETKAAPPPVEPPAVPGTPASAGLMALAAKSDTPPGYRLSLAPGVACAGCKFFSSPSRGLPHCSAYQATVTPDHVCDDFATPAVAQGSAGKGVGGPHVDDPDAWTIDSRADRGVQ